MQEVMRKHRIETTELIFAGPMKNKNKAILALSDLGFKDVSDSVPWEDAFPEYDRNDLSGVCLRGARYKENITQKQLSEMTGISQCHISEMENGKRQIDVKTAKKLAKVLNVGYKVFL